jgi:hypothetical protein
MTVRARVTNPSRNRSTDRHARSPATAHQHPRFSRAPNITRRGLTKTLGCPKVGLKRLSVTSPSSAASLRRVEHVHQQLEASHVPESKGPRHTQVKGAIATSTNEGSGNDATLCVSYAAGEGSHQSLSG